MTTEILLFYMQRYSVCLETTLRPNGHVCMKPHNCPAKDLRLWQSIAQTQTTLAQSLLDANKQAKPVLLLRSLFLSKGWTIGDATEP